MIPGGELESIHDCIAALESAFQPSNSSGDVGLESRQKEEVSKWIGETRYGPNNGMTVSNETLSASEL